jgi:hypothetical protein
MINRRSLLKGGVAVAFLPWIGNRGVLVPPVLDVNPNQNLQNAIDALNGQGTIQLTEGDFELEDPITIDGYIQIWGRGQESTFLSYEGEGSAFLVNSGQEITTSRWLCQNLSILGNDLGERGLTIGQNTVGPYSANMGGMQNVRVAGFTEAGLFLESSQINRFIHCSFTHNVGHGVVVNSSAGCKNTNTAFIACYLKLNEKNGLYAENGSQIMWRDCLFEANTEEGIKLNRVDGDCCRAWTFDGCYIEDNGKDGFWIDASTGLWQTMSLVRPHLSSPASGYYHINAGRASLHVVDPSVVPGKLGTDMGYSTCYTLIESDKEPNWDLGGANSPTAWLVKGARYGPLAVWVNDGAGEWEVES